LNLRVLLSDDTSRILGLNLFPSCLLSDEMVEKIHKLRHRYTDLLHAITLTKSDGLILKGDVVDSDGERNAKLISTSITTADGCTSGIDLVAQVLVLEIHADLMYDRVETLLSLKREHGHLDGSDLRRKGEHTTIKSGLVLVLAIVRTAPVGMLEDAVEDTTDTERGLDDVRDEGLTGLLLLAHLDLDHLRLQHILLAVVSLEGELLVLLEGSLHCGKLVLVEAFDVLEDVLGVLAESLANDALLQSGNKLLDHAWAILEWLVDGHALGGAFAVAGEIVVCTVSVANALDPAVGGADLSIPAIGSVVSHLRVHVLTETKMLLGDAELGQEEEGAAHEVGKGLIADDSLVRSLADLDGSGFAGTLLLLVSRKQVDNELADGGEARVGLVAGVDKVLDLSKRELTHTEKTGARSNLVTEGTANLGSGEGQLASVEVEKTLEVDKDTLGGLGAEEAGHITSRTNASLEHQIERCGVGDVVASDRGLHVVLAKSVAEALLVQIIHTSEIQADCWTVCFGGFLRLEKLLEVLLQEMISTVASVVLCITNHVITELCSMARSIQNGLGGENRAINLRHGIMDNKVILPSLNDVGLYSTAWGTEIIKTGNTTIGRKRRSSEESPLQKIFHSSAV